jgi:glyoxylase-like metal-dependent hydrolase (beta-lactamase superfamily II)
MPLRLLCAVTLLLASGCLTVPLAPEQPEATHFVAPPRSTPVPLTVTPLRMGHRRVPRCAPAGEASCFSPAEIEYSAYLVKHPKGTFLIDGGLSSHGDDDLSRFGLLQRMALAWIPEGELASDLQKAGDPRIDFVIVTHAHWDHTSGLTDLHHPRVLLGPGELAFARAWPKDEPPAVMADHLNDARVESVTFDGPAYENFPASHDVFGDGSVVLVPLPGHTPGSLGVFLNGVHGRRLLFIGDAAWSRSGVTLPSHKLKPLSHLVDADPDALSQTLWRLHALHEREPGLIIVPAHDAEASAEVDRLAN